MQYTDRAGAGGDAAARLRGAGLQQAGRGMSHNVLGTREVTSYIANGVCGCIASRTGLVEVLMWLPSFQLPPYSKLRAVCWGVVYEGVRKCGGGKLGCIVTPTDLMGMVTRQPSFQLPPYSKLYEVTF